MVNFLCRVVKYSRYKLVADQSLFIVVVHVSAAAFSEMLMFRNF